MKRLIALLFCLALLVPTLARGQGAFVFPPNPTLNQEVIGPGGVVYVWDGLRWTIRAVGASLPVANPTFTGTLTGPTANITTFSGNPAFSGSPTIATGLRIGSGMPALGANQPLGMRIDGNAGTAFYIANNSNGGNATAGLLLYNNTSISGNYATYGQLQINSSGAGGTGANRVVLSSYTTTGMGFANVSGNVTGNTASTPFLWWVGTNTREIMSLAVMQTAANPNGNDCCRGPALLLKNTGGNSAQDTQYVLQPNVNNYWLAYWLNSSTNADGVGGGVYFRTLAATNAVSAAGFVMLGADCPNSGQCGVGGWGPGGWWQHNRPPAHVYGNFSFDGSVGVGAWGDEVQGGPALGAVNMAYGASIAPWGWGVMNYSNAHLSANGNWIAVASGHALLNETGASFLFYLHNATTAWHQFNNWTLFAQLSVAGWHMAHQLNLQTAAAPAVTGGDLAPGSRDSFGQIALWPGRDQATLHFGQPYVGNSVCMASADGAADEWIPYDEGPDSVSFSCLKAGTDEPCGGGHMVQYHCAGTGG